MIFDLKGEHETDQREGFIQYDYLKLTYMNRDLIIGIYEVDLEDIDMLFKAKSKNLDDFKNSIFLFNFPQ